MNKRDAVTNYWDALEKQVELWHLWRSDAGRGIARSFWQKMMAILEEKDRLANADHYWRDQIHIVEVAEPYYVSPSICELLDSSLDSLPDLALRDVRIPSPAGWVYYALPQRVAKLYEESISHIIGFTWSQDEIMPDALELMFYTRHVSSGRLVPLTRFSWLARDTWRKVPNLHDIGPLEPYRGNIESGLVNMRRCVAAFLAFIMQPIAVTTRTEVSRSTRKRIQQAGLALEPIVRVIALRRREYPVGRESQPKDWSCRWIVRTHWRNQYYPSKGVHKPKLIPAYVKGPEDKPLKKPSMPLFAVVR